MFVPMHCPPLAQVEEQMAEKRRFEREDEEVSVQRIPARFDRNRFGQLMLGKLSRKSSVSTCGSNGICNNGSHIGEMTERLFHLL